VIWASGTHGTYLQSTDGGKHWRAAQVPGAETLDFRDVEAFSADEAYLLAAGPGEQSRIYKTTNGGKSWVLQFTNHDAKGFFDCMAFWDREHGIAVGDPVNGKFQLITTENGGKDWNPIPPEKLPPAIEGEGAFAASGTCVAVQGKKNVWFVSGGSAARVFHSSNAGESWEVSETPIVHGPASAGIFSIAFRDSKHGVIAGGDYKKPELPGPNLAVTSDSGATWVLAPLENSFYFSAVTYTTDAELLAVGTNGSVRSSKAASMWQSEAFKGLNAVVVTEHRITAVGGEGHIATLNTYLESTPALATVLILSNVHGVDVSGVVNEATQKIRERWFQLVPEIARPPLRKQGTAVVDFSIQKDGTIQNVRLRESTKDFKMDEAAVRSVAESSPVAHLPSALDLPPLAIRMRFLYNPPKR
jgi:TonB family protein